MELMKGRFLLGQLGVLSLVAFLFAIAYGVGTWWSLEWNGLLEVSMSLWEVCSSFGDNNVCNPITSNDMVEGKIFDIDFVQKWN